MIVEGLDRATFQATEWLAELGEEVPHPSLDRLPLVLGRGEMTEILATGSELEQLAWQALYSSGVREAEFLALAPEDLKDDHLVAAGRLVLMDLKCLARLRQLEGKTLFPWTMEELRKRLRKAARATGVMERFERSGRTLLPSVFRHAYAGHRIENGMDLLTLKNLLGHASLWTTFKLNEVAIGRWRPAYEQYHPLAPSPTPRVRAKEKTRRTVPGEGESYKLQPADLTLEEVTRMMATAAEDRDRLIVRTAYASALRVGELAELLFLDLVPREARVFVRSGKGDFDRYTLIDHGTAQALEAWRGSEPLGNSVFDLSARQLNRIVTDLGKKLGLQAKYEPLGQSVSPHALRHAHATHCYEAGMDIFSLKKLLGHTYLTSTEKYVNQHLAHQRKVYEQSGG